MLHIRIKIRFSNFELFKCMYIENNKFMIIGLKEIWAMPIMLEINIINL